jgi:subtilisin family serine protease
MKQYRTFVFVLVVMALGLMSSQPVFARSQSNAPLLAADAAGVVRDRYIVVFKSDAADADVDAEVRSARAVGQVHYQYTAALKGFAATLPEAALEGLRRNPQVDYIEADQEITLDATQTGATWGLDRIDQASLPLSGTYSYTNTGAGVKAYIIDTGILTTHQEFGGRASYGFDAVKGKGAGTDCHGHGTHVAGTVGGATYGVAKGVTLVAVRVLNCRGSGTTSGVVAGIDWVTLNHTGNNPAVANMSLGGGASTAIDTAVKNSIADGVTYALAAGNENTNACNRSPARVAEGITVGATTSTDARASYSNYGACLDLFAPGSSITSAWKNNNTSTNTISGTSMATPHVAGVAALYLQGSPSASPATVRNAIVNGATAGKVTNPGTGSPNLLLFTNY